MVYIRSSPKVHGKGNKIERIVKKNQKVLVVEDLISTGGSSIDTVNVLKSMETEVIGVIAIFTYGLQKSVNQFESEKIPWTTLTNFDYIIEALLEDQDITKSDQTKLIDLLNNTLNK